MNGNAEVIELLNEVLTAELTAINQYFIDAKMLIERILYLDGVPNLQRLGTVRVGEDVPEKLRLALDVEKEAIVRLTRGIELCYSSSDHGSRDLLEKILEGEEEHADWLETQLVLV